ncbi:MAG: EAL domain-containing protein [Burkholderiaceae bacterium]
MQTLKVDRSFIITMLDNPDTMTLVQTIISLAHSLRLKVVAEGVIRKNRRRFFDCFAATRCRATYLAAQSHSTR